MNKKLMAVAVAGALAMPALAFAADPGPGPIQIYGVFNAEYGFADQPNDAAGNPRPNFDGFNSGASRIGFRGEAKAGGDLVAWVQCESQLNVWSNVDTTVTGWCSRNSAIGLKGGWGNVYVGTWDTPLKRAVGVTRITNETGWLATAHILSSDDEMGLVADFSNRPRHTINYDSPSFGGFTLSLQTTSTNRTSGALTTDAGTKGREYSVSGVYSSGPLAVIAAMEVHNKNTQNSFFGGEGKDTGKALGVSYVFGPVKVGFTYLDLESDDGAGLTLGRKNWNLAAEWRLGGPHMLRFGYLTGGDLETNVVGDIPDSGVKQYQISYLYSFTSRITGTLGYVKLDNDTNGFYWLRDSLPEAEAFNVQPGSSQSAFVIGFQYTF